MKSITTGPQYKQLIQADKAVCKIAQDSFEN